MRIIFTSPAVYDRRFPSVWKRREHRYVGRRPIPDTGLYLGVSYGRLPTIRLQCGRGYLTRRQYIVRVCVAHGFPIFIAITPLSAFHAYNVCVCVPLTIGFTRYYVIILYVIITTRFLFSSPPPPPPRPLAYVYDRIYPSRGPYPSKP